LIAKEGRVVLRKGYGWANEERKIPMTTNSVFDIGSVTKQFTATAILKLEEQGKLKVTDPITKFFKDVPEDKQNITVHQLLTHTAGFGHDVETTKFPPRDEMVGAALDSKLKLKSGETFSYSNAGYSLLAAIIEIVSGMPYENYLHKYLWKPSGMYKTGNLIPRFSQEEMAQGYDISGNLGFSQDKWWDKDGPFWGGRGAGYVLSTLEDLYKWHLTLKGNKILSKQSKQKLYSPYATFKDRKEGWDQAESWNYGYGWAIYKTPRGTRLIEHTGGNSIVSTDFLRYIDEEVVIIYFTSERKTISLRLLNSITYSGVNSITDSVSPVFFGNGLPTFQRPKIALTNSELQKYAGTYELPSGDKFVLEMDRNQLQASSLALGVGKLLTKFPKLQDSERLDNLEARTAKLIESIAREDFEPIRDLIYFDGTLDEEKDYWKRTFANWTPRFGAFRSSEVIGSVQEKEFLVTYVLLQFELGTTIVQYRQNENKKFYIGFPAFLFPRYYRLIPQSKSEFVVYNHALKTSTQVDFSFSEKNVVTGLSIDNEQGKVYARKVSPLRSE
jgi:CubicO group peptidase (beta-lactamase class C family)